MAYCVNGSWTVSNKIAIGTETLGLGLTLQGSAVGDAAIGFRNSSATGRNWSIYATGNEFSQGAGNLLFYREWCDGGGQTMVLSCMGHLGMGTCTPTHPIHIYDKGNSVYARWERSTGNMYIGSDSIGGAVGTIGNIPLYFWTCDGTERMRISIAGCVGIGTNDPITRLHVEQSTSGEVGRFRANVAGCADLVLVNNAQTWGLRVDNAVSNALHIRNFQVSTNIMTFATGGNIGVGNTSPAGQFSLNGVINDCKLLVYDAGIVNDRYGFGIRTSQFMMYSANAGDACGGITFGKHDGTTFTEHVRFMNGGNVGIGVSCAVYKLDVQCSIGNYLVRLYNTKTGDSAGLYVKAGSNAGNEIIKGEDYSGNPRFLVGACGNVSINNASINTSYKLYVNGAFYAAGSSCEYKTQICQYNTDSCMFMKLKPVTYQYKDEYTHLGKELKSGTQIGLIAEDVAEVYPELAILVNEDDQKIVRNVDYEKLSIVLLSEVQKLRKELDELKTK